MIVKEALDGSYSKKVTRAVERVKIDIQSTQTPTKHHRLWVDKGSTQQFHSVIKTSKPAPVNKSVTAKSRFVHSRHPTSPQSLHNSSGIKKWKTRNSIFYFNILSTSVEKRQKEKMKERI